MPAKRVMNKIKGGMGSGKGFSLVEVLVTVLIFSGLAAAVNAVLLVGDASWQTNNVQMELQQELRKAMDWMKDDLRQTGSAAITNVPVNPAPDAVTYPDPADDPAYSWYSTITFRMVSGVSGGKITWDSGTVQFVLGGTDSSQLQRVEGSTTKVIAQNIQSLQFRRLAAASNMVEVALQAQKDTFKGATINSSLEFKIQLRN